MDQLETARDIVERTIKVHSEIGTGATAPTGEPYVSLVSGGIKAEGERLPAYFSTPERAIVAWYDSALRYAQHGNVLYWRELPSLESQQYAPVDADGEFAKDTDLRKMMTITVYTVYSRLLVSDKPIIQPARIEHEYAELGECNPT